MAKLAANRSARAGSVTTTLVVLASVGLNVLLAAQLFQRRVSLPEPPAAAGGHQFADGSKLPGSVSATHPLTGFADTNALPFRWSDVESTDYRQYIANLRAVGCPEPIIRDIIVADVNQLFAPRAAAIWKARVPEYWQKPKTGNANPEQVKQLMALSKDKTAVLQDLLGVRLDDQQTVNTVCLQVYGNEQNLLFLPADKRDAALQALADVDSERKSDEAHARAGYSNEVDRKLFNETLETLAKVLTPAELEEFRMRGSPSANALRNEAQYFDCTPEEFRQLLDWREHAGQQNLSDRLAGATEEVRKLFGDERAQEFARVTDSFYINTRQAAEKQDVPLERVDQAWEVTRDTRAAAKSVAQNSNLSASERTRQLQALQQQAEARLNELLGPKTAAGVIFNLHAIVTWGISP